MCQEARPITRFYSLDVLRGVAALGVVLWHWQHFFFVGTEPGALDRMQQPFATYLMPLYTHGDATVDLFFCLSGFIFYWLYAVRIADRSVSLAQFVGLRFSRLYPLHFATLIIVAVLQGWLWHAQNSYFVYAHNDTKHFVLQLLFASAWGMETGFSFNGPIWSVSVEILLYALFFLLCRALPVRSLLLLALSVVGWLGVEHLNVAVGRGIGSFFIGGWVYLAYRRVSASPSAPALTKASATLAACAWGLTWFFSCNGNAASLLTLKNFPPLVRFESGFQSLLPGVLNSWPLVVVFPLTILALALVETRRGTLGKRLSGVGDISYSSYLLHFPLQIVFYLVLIRQFSLDRSTFLSPWTMLAFFAILVPLSLCSFRFFETPAQRWLRRLLQTRRANAAGDSTL